MKFLLLFLAKLFQLNSQGFVTHKKKLNITPKGVRRDALNPRTFFKMFLEVFISFIHIHGGSFRDF